MTDSFFAFTKCLYRFTMRTEKDKHFSKKKLQNFSIEDYLMGDVRCEMEDVKWKM